MDSEPFVGDHWQTDIYAGSSSSASDSSPSTDSDRGSTDGRDHAYLAPRPSNSTIHKTASNVPLSPDDARSPKDQTLAPGLCELEQLMKNAYWLKSDFEKGYNRLPELIAVREVLAALLNVGGRLIFSIPSSNYNHPITLSPHAPALLHKSLVASLSLFSSFLPILASLRILRYQSESGRHVSGPSKQIGEAFSACIVVLLQRFDVFLTSIEVHLLNLPTCHNPEELTGFMPESAVSLMRLHHRLDENGWFVLFTSLASAVSKPNICDFRSPQSSRPTKVFLDNLYRIACHFDSYCNSAVAVEQMKIIFLKTCEPVWMWIGDWIMYGRLPEARSNQGQGLLQKVLDEGFFIRISQPEESNTVTNWWEDHYFLKQDAIPEFLQDFAEEVLEGGKAQALSHILGIFPDTPRFSWPKLTELVKLTTCVPSIAKPQSNLNRANVLRLHLRPTSHCYRSPERVEQNTPAEADYSAPTFALSLYSRIKYHLSPFLTRNHSELHRQFFSPCKLSVYLSELNEFFLLGSEPGVQFLKKIFDETHDSLQSSSMSTHLFPNSSNWWEEPVINANLSKAFECSPSPIISSFLPKVKTSPSIRTEEDPIKYLEMINISLSISTPLNYVLDNAHIIANYNKCFVFLSQLARAAWTLDSLIWVKPILTSNSFLCTKEFEKRVESKEFYRLRNRLAWFVNLMTDYCMNLVITKWKIRIVEALNAQVGNLSQTILCTRRWLDRLIGLMFLSQQCRSLNRVILNVLRLCTKSHEIWAAFCRRANAFRLIEDINEAYIDADRRRRQIERRRRRMKNEQYTLIEEESRHIDLSEVMNSIVGEPNCDEGGNQPDDQVKLEHQASDPLSPFSTTALPFSHLMINSDGVDYLTQFQKMNLEFEKFLISFQRGVGKLCTRTGLRPTKKSHYRQEQEFHSASLDNDSIDSKTLPGLGSEDSEDLDTLTLLECRLDEWIV